MTQSPAHSENETISLTTYTLVFIALMCLLVLTVWVATLPWNVWKMGPESVAIALLIALAKALLVAVFFMHLKFANRLTQIVIVSVFVWLGIMFLLSFSDYLTRGWLPDSAGWVNQSTEGQVHNPYYAPHIMPPENAAKRPQVQPAAQ